MYQHDVPFGVKEYVDAKLRRHIDEHKGHSKQGDDSTAGKQDAAGGSGQNAAVDSGNDTGKGATAGKPETKPAASKPEGERPRSGTDADAVKDKPVKSKVDDPKQLSPGTILYHGTRGMSPIKKGKTLYLTADPYEAQAYALGKIPGTVRGSAGDPTVRSFKLGGFSSGMDINAEVEEALMEGDDVDPIIDAAVERARKLGYGHVTFNHPSASSHKDSGDEFPVIIPTFPEDMDEHDSYDGKSMKRHAEKSETQPATKPKAASHRSGTDADAMKPDLPYEPSTDEISRYVGNIRNSQNMDFEYKTMPVASIKPSQSGEDYINDSSRETARIHKQYKTGDDIGYRGDFMPIVVDEDNNIIDGNHRHAAHTMNGWKNMRVLVAKKGGTGKVKGVPMQKSVLDVSHIRKAGVKALCLLRKRQ